MMDAGTPVHSLLRPTDADEVVITSSSAPSTLPNSVVASPGPRVLLPGVESGGEGQEHQGGEASSKGQASTRESFSRATMDRSIAAKMYIEQYYDNLLKSARDRGERRQLLEKKMENLHLSNKEQNDLRKDLDKKESEHIRMKRTKLSPKDFVTIRIIGRGAFGEVHLVRRKSNDHIYAMKKLRKSEMLKKEQVAHVRAERDILAIANNGWVVKLYCSFQDETYLYLVMEYLPGGDMMTMLIKYDIFTEEAARFYIAETVLAIESIHQLNFLHRDIKPDNLLLDDRGHIKLTDFGLCTGFQRMHSSSFYQKLVGEAMTIKLKLASETMLTRTERIASWKKMRRTLAYSAVGTPDYTAPEVFLQIGYGEECDWWSVGVIMFEMLIGYPPFLSDNSTETCLKILNCRETLRFPDDVPISREARDLIERLVCERSERLGVNGAEEIKAHPFFRGVPWDSLREVTAPFVPTLKGPDDSSNFEIYEELPDPGDSLPSGIKGLKTQDLPFIGYTFKNFDHKEKRKQAQDKSRPTLDDIFTDSR
eukprot:TRINITY_DN1250_c0_g1_i1.p1 TRINITY_DN1250_c0_g1~~TRINITY_DN1250_c0_g1_i1.p1  ORF type:complete len:537 (+),score=124.19 TRINITY_DN1250_c0_g1_i1:150-1760(+)